MSLLLPPKLPPASLEIVRELRLNVPESLRADVLRFYCDVFGLARWPDPRQFPGGLGLGSPRKGLWLQWRHADCGHPARRRMTLTVGDLALTARMLAARGWEPRRRRGFSPLEEALLVHDPAGHLVEIRARHVF